MSTNFREYLEICLVTFKFTVLRNLEITLEWFSDEPRFDQTLEFSNTTAIDSEYLNLNAGSTPKNRWTMRSDKYSPKPFTRSAKKVAFKNVLQHASDGSISSEGPVEVSSSEEPETETMYKIVKTSSTALSVAVQTEELPTLGILEIIAAVLKKLLFLPKLVFAICNFLLLILIMCLRQPEIVCLSDEDSSETEAGVNVE